MGQSLSGGTLILPETGERITYTVTHRARVTRRMHLELDAEGGLQVTVPGHWSPQQTQQLLLQHLPGVQRFINQARQQQLPALSWSEGAQHLLHGRSMILQLQDQPRRGIAVSVAGDTLLISGPQLDSGRVRTALRAFYHREASTHFRARLEYHQQRAPWARGRALRLALRRMRRTWGTCNREGVIRLNTHLIKAPTTLQDYVICHELCHLRQMNHSAAFYALQESICPDWRAFRERLRAQGHHFLQE
ncbi:MAG: DUF45 domain-containing protein [Xanthomonadales bacterium]|nr:DUF45 domain-containing protein [Xanthomonadales bacterium]